SNPAVSIPTPRSRSLAALTTSSTSSRLRASACLFPSAFICVHLRLIVWSLPAGAVSAGEAGGFVGGAEAFDDLADVAVEDRLQAVDQVEVDAVVGDAVLAVVVGADL